MGCLLSVWSCGRSRTVFLTVSVLCLCCRACAGAVRQIRDEKRVFFKYWAERHALIFKSTKRFRLLPPFPGSHNTTRFPKFTRREIDVLWTYVRSLHPNFEHYTLLVLNSGVMIALDYTLMAAELKWTVQRYCALLNLPLGVRHPVVICWSLLVGLAQFWYDQIAVANSASVGV